MARGLAGETAGASPRPTLPTQCAPNKKATGNTPATDSCPGVIFTYKNRKDNTKTKPVVLLTKNQKDFYVCASLRFIFEDKLYIDYEAWKYLPYIIISFHIITWCKK